MMKGIHHLIDEISECEVESAQRAADGASETFSTTFAVSGFESPKTKGRRKRKPTRTRSKTKRAT
jgi:hypothetical protein